MGTVKSSRQSKTNRGRQINTRWRDRFLEALAQSSNVTKSAAAAGVDTSSAYRARTAEPDFARRWMDALWEGYEHLEMEVLRRLREGEFQTDGGDKYDFASAIRLLSAHRENAAKAQAARRNVSASEIRASIDRKVEEIRQRVLREAKENSGNDC
jgi:hypothetical protein